MQFWPDTLLSPSPQTRRWFIVGIVLLPIIMTASGLDAYYLTETWVWFKPHTWKQVLAYPFTLKSDMLFGHYRPVADMVLAIEHKLFGTNPLVPRALTFATYSVICLLVFLILEALSGSFITGALGSLIFAVMVSHVQPAFWMAAQVQTVNAALFSLLTFWLLGPGYRKRPSRMKVVIAFISYPAGFLSYEYALFTPLLLLIYELVWKAEPDLKRAIKRVFRLHLPLWALMLGFLGLKAMVFSTFDPHHPYLLILKSLTLSAVLAKIPAIVYTSVFPLKFSPILCAAAAYVLLYVGRKANWRFLLFVILWIVITPAFALPLPSFAHHRVFLNSVGLAGLMAYLIVLLPNCFLDTQKRSASASILDWLLSASIIYWVFEIMRAGWIDFFHQDTPAPNVRYYIALVAGIAILTRCAVVRRFRVRLTSAPLKALVLGLILLIIGGYTAGFLKLFALFVDEADEAARLPKAIVAVQPDVPDNTLIFIVFKDEALIDEASFLWNIRAPLRAEYNARVDAFPFGLWVSGFQYQSIPEGMSVRAFGYDGEKASELPELAARIIARQESYLGLESDVVHARFSNPRAQMKPVRLAPGADSGLIDRADIVTARPLRSATARVEFTTRGASGTLTFPASFEGTEATVRFDQNPQWLLAGQVDEVRLTVLDDGQLVPIREAALVQSAGLISRSGFRFLHWTPKLGPALRGDTPLSKVPGAFPARGIRKYLALP